MNVSTYFTPVYSAKNNRLTTPSFKGRNCVETLTHTNIGGCLEGCIGKVKVRRANGGESYLSVFKKYLCAGYENYSIRNEAEEVLGEISFTVHNYHNYRYDFCIGAVDPSHVFVTELRNYSNPSTPYYRKGLEPHKDIGTRLLQIAQRRSDEAQCHGNIKLISKNESKEWYKKVIGMTEEFPPEQNYGLRCKLHNSNSMILPPHAKEPLSKLQGGL